MLFAAASARRWGAERVGPIYGWLFSANMPAALAPVLAGLAYDRSPGTLVSGTVTPR